MLPARNSSTRMLAKIRRLIRTALKKHSVRLEMYLHCNYTTKPKLNCCCQSIACVLLSFLQMWYMKPLGELHLFQFIKFFVNPIIKQVKLLFIFFSQFPVFSVLYMLYMYGPCLVLSTYSHSAFHRGYIVVKNEFTLTYSCE